MKKISTVDYLINEGKKLYDKYTIELKRAAAYYGAESKQVEDIEKKIIRVITQLDKLTSVDDLRGICI